MDALKSNGHGPAVIQNGDGPVAVFPSNAELHHTKRLLGMVLDEIAVHRRDKKAWDRADYRLHERVRLLTR